MTSASPTVPRKLRRDDTVRVIAPARSRQFVAEHDHSGLIVYDNDGWWPLRPGQAAGRIVGGNLCTLNLLQGTGYMPSLDGALLMVEDDCRSDGPEFARDLASLLQLPDAGGRIST